MLGTLIEAALRSLILAGMVGVGLRLFRIQNVVSRRYAWIAVLIGSLLMPFALPWSARWRLFPAATIPAPSSLDHLQADLTPPAETTVKGAASSGDAASASRMRDQRGTSRIAAAANSRNPVYAPSFNYVRSPAPESASLRTVATGAQFSLLGIALAAYILIAAALLVRLLFGLATALYLWRTSTPIRQGSVAEIGTDPEVRFNHQISTPVAMGSGVVLPADYGSWREEKLRIVLAHERSHVYRRDFQVQFLASLYAALAWFSPLGWWLKRKLSDFSETISDRCGLAAASSRAAYAEVLLEFAAMPRPTFPGVAMARPSSISRRIERLLNDSYLRRAFSGGARLRVAVLTVPALLFAASSLVRVRAATHAGPFAPTSKAMIATMPAAPAAVSGSSTSRKVSAPSALATSTASPFPAKLPTAAAAPRLVPPELALGIPPALPGSPAGLEDGAIQSEASFDRNLSFNGKLVLSVGTASGNIKFTRGPANQIHIHGVVKANKNGDPAQVQQIVANPPIEQQGNIIRIGAQGENLHNISISYEIEAPADTMLSAATASGNIADTGVGDGAKLITASGNITATGLGGGFIVQTGSGNIAIEGAGQGDAKAQTGSGDIDLKGVNGALKAQTGSGTIRATGTPSSAWKLQTGSGNIELTTGTAPMNLDASTGSGSISTTSSTATEGANDRHHIHTQLNGGGPEVRLETGSGDIRID